MVGDVFKPGDEVEILSIEEIEEEWKKHPLYNTYKQYTDESVRWGLFVPRMLAYCGMRAVVTDDYNNWRGQRIFKLKYDSKDTYISDDQGHSGSQIIVLGK